MLTCLLVFHDCVFVPFRICFGVEALWPQLETLFLLLNYFAKFIYAIDVILGFRKAYLHEKIGIEVSDPKLIAVRYLKFNFWIDLISAIPFEIISDNPFLQLVTLVKLWRLRELKHMIRFMNFQKRGQRRVRLTYMILRMVILIHWTSCFFYALTQYNWWSEIETQDGLHHQTAAYTVGSQSPSHHCQADILIGPCPQLQEGLPHPWNYNYWIPQVDMAHKQTDYYDLAPLGKYNVLNYYSILLITGNDIMPSRISEFLYCASILFTGAFFEAYIFGAITAELHAQDDQHTKSLKLIEYVKYSTYVHFFPAHIRMNILSYMNKFSVRQQVQQDQVAFLDFLNPALRYNIMSVIRYKIMKEFQIFRNSYANEIIFVAQQMETKIFMHEEKIITQDDFDKSLYVILEGSASVYLRCKQEQPTIGKMQSIMQNETRKAKKRMNGRVTIEKLESMAKPNDVKQEDDDNGQKSSMMKTMQLVVKGAMQTQASGERQSRSLQKAHRPKHFDQRERITNLVRMQTVTLGEAAVDEKAPVPRISNVGELGYVPGQGKFAWQVQKNDQSSASVLSKRKQYRRSLSLLEGNAIERELFRKDRTRKMTLIPRQRQASSSADATYSDISKSKAQHSKNHNNGNQYQRDLQRLNQRPSVNAALRQMTFRKPLSVQNKLKLKIIELGNEMSNYQMINRLSVGHVFGEIGLLTRQRRTCTVISNETCMLQSLSPENYLKIAEKFPSLFDKAFEQMYAYDDDEMMQKRQFVENVPYFRKLDYQTISQIVFQMTEKCKYQMGDVILQNGVANANILILFEGTIQVRVGRKDCNTGKIEDYWFATLSKGACINAYNSFSKTNSSLLSFYASSDTCIVNFINVDKLKEFSKNDTSETIIILSDRLKLIVNGMKANIYDDLDFFPFPSNEYLENIVQKSDDELINERISQIKTQINIARSLRIFVQQLKLGKVNFPRAVDLLKLIRQDRVELERKISCYDQGCNQIVQKQFDVQGVYEELRDNQIKNVERQMQNQLNEIDSEYKIGTSSVSSNQRTDAMITSSVQLVSFKSRASQFEKHYHDIQGSHREEQKKYVVDLEAPRMRVHYLPQRQLQAAEPDATSSDQRIKSFQSAEKELYNIKAYINRNIKQLRLWNLQTKQAQAILKTTAPQDNPFLGFDDILLHVIEERIQQFLSFDLLVAVISKMNEDAYVFDNMLSIANSNIQSILQSIETSQFEHILNFISKGYINQTELPAQEQRKQRRSQADQFANIGGGHSGIKPGASRRKPTSQSQCSGSVVMQKEKQRKSLGQEVLHIPENVQRLLTSSRRLSTFHTMAHNNMKKKSIQGAGLSRNNRRLGIRSLHSHLFLEMQIAGKIELPKQLREAKPALFKEGGEPELSESKSSLSSRSCRPGSCLLVPQVSAPNSRSSSKSSRFVEDDQQVEDKEVPYRHRAIHNWVYSPACLQRFEDLSTKRKEILMKKQKMCAIAAMIEVQAQQISQLKQKVDACRALENVN